MATIYYDDSADLSLIQGKNVAIVGFVDDDPLKWGTAIHGKAVIGSVEDLPPIVEYERVDELLIAMPSTEPEKLRRIVDICSEIDVEFRVLPGLDEVLRGRVSLDQVREIRIDDLLGRDPIQLELPELEEELSGKTVLITAGPTHEPIDPVRFIGNRSSGRMGFALAAAAWRRGADVKVVAGPVALPNPYGVEVLEVGTAREMLECVSEHLPEADVSIFASAVADYSPADPSEEKLKRTDVGREMILTLAENPDVAGETRAVRKTGSVSVGFALETKSLLENARAKLESKGFDLIVANEAEAEGAGFEVEMNRVVLLGADGETEELPLLAKDEVAEVILDRISGIVESGE